MPLSSPNTFRSDFNATEGTIRRAYREVAADVVLTLVETDATVLLLDSTAATKVVVVTAGLLGQEVTIRLVAASGGAYTIAVVGGTITLDAANEACSIVHDGTAWQLAALMGATFA